MKSINEIVETFLLSPDRELTRDVLIRHKHQPWETLVLKCEKLINDVGEVRVRGYFWTYRLKRTMI